MNNFEELVYNAMQSSLEGYAASVVDSIEFELKRELTTEEHQQVFVAVDRAITGIEVAQKEIADWRSVAEAAAQDDADWHKLADRDGELICKMANAIIAVGERAKKAEAALSAANEKLKCDQVPVEYQYRYHNHGTGSGEWCRVLTKERYEELQREHAGDNDFAFRTLFTAPQKPVVLSSSTVMSRAYVVQAIKAAGFTVEGE